MALFSRLFQSKKGQQQSTKCSGCRWPKLEGSVKWDIPDFKKSQVRLVVFKDQSLNGRTLLFDSKAVTRLANDAGKKSSCSLLGKNSQSSTERPGQHKYQFSRPGTDTNMLGEMMFGSIAMSYQGPSIKVHSIRCPPQIMFTKIFIPSPSLGRSRSSSCDIDNYDSYSLQSSFGDVTPTSQIYCTQRTASQPEIARSVPMEIPSPLRDTARPDDSGFSTSLVSSGSFTALPSPGGGASTTINSTCYKSLQRRWARSRQTCLEYGVRNRHSDPEPHTVSMTQPSPPCKKAQKVGIGILIDLYGEDNSKKNQDFVDFFFSHITLFERHVEKLVLAAEKAYFCKKQFIHLVVESFDVFCRDVYDLFMTPRLTEPVWLNMMSSATNRQIVCLQFMTEFTNLVLRHDSKDNNFFVTTLLTAVLTHHLAWVPTVTPSGILPSSTYLDKHSAKWLDTLAHSHPYNPLWAQLSDLYGAIGYPMKLARTVIVGNNNSLICTLLYILSYFLRCSEVYEKIELSWNFDAWAEFDPDRTKEMSPIQEDRSSDTTSSTDDLSALRANLSADRITNSDDGAATVESGTDEVSALISSASSGLHDFKCNGSLSNGCISEVTTSAASALVNSDVVPCKLSSVSLLPVQMESVKIVQKASPPQLSPAISPSDVVCPSTECSRKLSYSRFYVRLPSNDEAIVTEMDDYFDGNSEAKTLSSTNLSLVDKSCACAKFSCPKCSTKRCSDPEYKALDSLGGQSEDAGFASMESDVISDEVGARRSRHSSAEDRYAHSRPISQSGAPGRCRSLTPTELNRRRHVSSTSVDSENIDPFLRLSELPLTGACSEDDARNMKEFSRNFGHSLMAGFSERYLADFVLHGTNDKSFYQKLEADLTFSAKISVLDEPISEAACIVADVDNWHVYLMASNESEKLASPTITASHLVANLIESVNDFWKLRMPPEFCLMHLEDRLQEIYFKSRMLAEYLRHQKKSNIKDLTDVLGFDSSDLQLLLAVASTHSPELAFGIL